MSHRRREVGPRFEVVGRARPFEVVSPGFVVAESEASTYDGLRRSDFSPPAPFAAVEVSVEDSRGTVLAGLASGRDEHLLAGYDVASGRVGIEHRAGGMSTVLASSRVRRRVRRMAFVLCENQPTVLVDTGRGWRPVVTDRRRVALRTDFRVPGTLARFTAAWGSRGGTSTLGPVRAGLFGMAGLRDLHLVQHADGTPYVRDGRMFLTATCAGLGFFTQAHWGVFAFDPDALAEGDIRLEQTAHLFSHRNGLLLGDHAGQLVRDGDTWLVGVSSWGDFAPHRGPFVRHATTTGDLLSGVHVLDTELAPMPTGRGSYDPGMTRIDGRWFVSYVESVSHRPSRFHPALAVGPVGATHWTEGLQRVGEVPELPFCEGPVIARPDAPDGEWRVLASDGRARRYRVFDLTMRRLGDLAAPYDTNLPHPQIIDLPGGQRVMVTFDGSPYGKRVLGYGTHGDVLVMRAT
ncbi:MAG TPA: hypothetical protein VLB29_00865 [Nocardioidaceae bacterium]|nr:hypothetical protein [Nocardioidaceae bacterium]